jgi:hypothetical protein
MRRRDLFWLAGYPLYQLVGSLRHEAAHALAAIAYGGRVTEFVIVPTAGFFGYVRYAGAHSPFISAAPYLFDLLVFLPTFALCMTYPFRWRWLWIILVILGGISPLVNTAYNYNPWRNGFNDLDQLLDTTPPALVHGYFLLAIALYALGAILLFTRARVHARSERHPRRLRVGMAVLGGLVLAAATAYMTRRPTDIVFTDAFDIPSRRWVQLQGDWVNAGGVLQQLDQTEGLSLAMLDLPERRCYTYSLRVRVLDDGEGLRIPFRYNGGHVWWKLGGPVRRLSDLEGIAPYWIDQTGLTLEPNRWYTIEIRVNRSRAAGSLDGEQVWETEHATGDLTGLQQDLADLGGLVGLGTWSTRAEFDDIRLERTCAGT